MNRTSSIAAATAAAVLFLSSCGAAAEKAGEKATEKLIEEQTGGSVDVNTDGDGSVEIKTEDGSATFGTGEVPEEWPEFLTLPDDLEIQSGSTMDASDGRLVSIVGVTNESPEDILDRYKEALTDWEISGETTSTGGGSTLTGAQWDNSEARVTLAASDAQDDGKTFLTLGHTTLG
ncbi:MAG TPA: hypothetical protein VNS19_00010 [Acidimicrobiales bacterium]|nr:hypothetical protein [Acidimicrobiales bacterium]